MASNPCNIVPSRMAPKHSPPEKWCLEYWSWSDLKERSRWERRIIYIYGIMENLLPVLKILCIKFHSGTCQHSLCLILLDRGAVCFTPHHLVFMQSPSWVFVLLLFSSEGYLILLHTWFASLKSLKKRQQSY